ncbi:MAG TPA: adenosylcobinamide-GDP ribazoletransferase, partial [Rhodocyclaceae bacterium]|nr:adenosylcobinamide-GDP ribazoletransferase [Rhodocyclaceae bacterium]
MRHELELFFNALRFFTRLPIPRWVGHSTDLLNHSARYFPLVG